MTLVLISSPDAADPHRPSALSFYEQCMHDDAVCLPLTLSEGILGSRLKHRLLFVLSICLVP